MEYSQNANNSEYYTCVVLIFDKTNLFIFSIISFFVHKRTYALNNIRAKRGHIQGFAEPSPVRDKSFHPLRSDCFPLKTENVKYTRSQTANSHGEFSMQTVK